MQITITAVILLEILPDVLSSIVYSHYNIVSDVIIVFFEYESLNLVIVYIYIEKNTICKA